MDMQDDADKGVGVPIPRDEDFQSISDLVAEQLRLEEEIELAEEHVRNLKEQYQAVERGKLPAAIEKFGLSSFKLRDGKTEITVKDEVYAGITEERREAAMRWLAETGHDDIIKNQVSLNFGKGQESETNQLLGLLTEKGYSFQNNKSVHPSTLKAFIRQRLESGESVPMETFSVHIEKVAKIKSRKR